jgi:hypothetical protein
LIVTMADCAGTDAPTSAKETIAFDKNNRGRNVLDAYNAALQSGDNMGAEHNRMLDSIKRRIVLQRKLTGGRRLSVQETCQVLAGYFTSSAARSRSATISRRDVNKLGVNSLHERFPRCNFYTAISLRESVPRNSLRMSSSQYDKVDSVTFLEDWGESDDSAFGLMSETAFVSTVESMIEDIVDAIATAQSPAAAQAALTSIVAGISVDSASTDAFADLATLAHASLSYWTTEYEEWQDSVASSECDTILCVPQGDQHVSANRASLDFGEHMIAVATFVGSDIGVGGVINALLSPRMSRSSRARGMMADDADFRQEVRQAAGPGASSSRIRHTAIQRASSRIVRSTVLTAGLASATCAAVDAWTDWNLLGMC